ncbi:MAG: serine/threonine protein kinase, partial [Planctomycetaceae bacterium]|nr:serine/threonine protein kinase [Planctomycetaceae bacterium]
MPDHEDSLGGETLAGDVKADPAEQSLGDGSTLGGGEASSLSDTTDGEGEHLAAGLPVIDLGKRFEIEGELGQGGMGAVLLARDKSLGRQVAIKRILGTMIRSSAAVNRFITEAKSIAALNHHNIVQIYEFGQDDDGPLIVIEYVSGGSLLDRLKQGKLEPGEAIRITCQLCDALTFAHGKGIIHRDIKPANVLLTEDGVPKLTDFGLA